MDKQKRCQELEKQIQVLKTVMNSLLDDQSTLIGEILEEKKQNSESIESRFVFWAESTAPKLDYSYIVHVYTRNKKDLFDHNGLISPERRELVELDWVSEVLFDNLDMVRADGSCRNHAVKISEEDILDWMEELIKLNFGSMVYDW